MTKQRTQAIKPLKPGAEPYTLAPAYGTPNGVDTMLNIDAYSDAGEAQKEKFLQDGAKLLRAVGQALYAYGFRDIDLRTNRAGMAVSGEIHAEFRIPDGQRWLYVCLESTACRFLVPGRRDGVAIIARWREANGSRYVEGPNEWLDASLSSFELAHTLVRLVGLQPQPELLALPAPQRVNAGRTRRQPETLVMDQPDAWLADLERCLAESLEPGVSSQHRRLPVRRSSMESRCNSPCGPNPADIVPPLDQRVRSRGLGRANIKEFASMSPSLLVQRGCAPLAQFPLQQTVLRASAAELAEIRAFWERKPERVFKAASDDTRLPAPGIDPIDGTRSLALHVIEWAEGLQAADAASAVRRRVAIGTWAAPLRTPPVLAVTDGDVLLQAQAAYSGDCLHRGQPIREPFVYNGRRWTCVSFAGVEQPQAICREVVPLAGCPDLDPSSFPSDIDDTLAGKPVVLAGEQWVITGGQLIVTAPATMAGACEELSSMLDPAPIESEAEAYAPLHVHDRDLLFTAIGRYSGDLARSQLRLREPFRYGGRAWACLAYTPDGQPQQLTSVMCRAVVPLIDVDPTVATTAVCSGGADAWTGKQLRDPSGRFVWLVTSRELVITCDVPAALRPPMAPVMAGSDSVRFPHSASATPADKPMPAGAFVVTTGRTVQLSFFE